MNLNDFIPQEMVSAFGWTIVHSFWQGAVVAIILSIILILLSKSSAKIRSYISYAGLIIITAASIRTFASYSSAANEISNPEKSLHEFVIYQSEINSAQPESESILINVQKRAAIFIVFLKNLVQNNLNILVSIWLAGILILIIRLTGGLVYTQRVKHLKTFPADELWHMSLQKLTDKICIVKKVKLVQSAVVNFPMVIGYFKPVILMPAAVFTGLPQNQIEAIIAHELAHIKRGDYLLNIVQSIIEIFYFFNPSVWYISSVIRKEREYSCDELAVEICGDSLTLAKALVAIEQNSNEKPAFALGAISNNNSLISRIKKMTKNNNNDKLIYPKKLTVIISLVLSLAAITAIACSSNIDSLNKNEQTELQENSSINSGLNYSNELSKEIETPERPQKQESPVMNDDEDDRKTISFYENKNNQNIHWKLITEKGNIVEVYKNDNKLSAEEINENEDHLMDKLSEIKERLNEIEELDLDELYASLQNLKSKFKMNFDSLHNFHFNDESFAESMEKLKEGLKQLKKHNFQFDFEDKINFKFDREEFREKIDELKENLQGFDNRKFKFDSEKFEESMNELKKNLKNFKIDMSEFTDNMTDFKTDMSVFKNEMKELKVELKKLDAFLDETKVELKKDGYVDAGKDDYEMELSVSKMTVNGIQLPDNLHKKYLGLYEKHFGKKLDDKVVVK